MEKQKSTAPSAAGSGAKTGNRHRALFLAAGCLLAVGLVVFLLSRHDEPPAPPPAPASPGFSLTEDAFVGRFVAAGQSVRPNINLAPVVRKEGTSSLLAMYPITGVQGSVLNIATRKGEDRPYNIFVTSENIRDATQAFDLVIQVLNPELSERDRVSLRVDLQLDGGPFPTATLKTARGTVSYQFSAMGAGVFMLGASPL